MIRTHARRSAVLLLALALTSGLAVTQMAVPHAAVAKAADKVGQNPTDAYADGRGADIVDERGGANYISGLGFDIGAIIKFHKGD